MSDPGQDEDGFAASKLGTKEYWDSCYDTENVNFDDHGDVGEVWFGEEAAARVVTWLEDREQEGDISLDSAILDLGCGNGVLSVDLSKAGFTNVTGELSLQLILNGDDLYIQVLITVKVQLCWPGKLLRKKTVISNLTLWTY